MGFYTEIVKVKNLEAPLDPDEYIARLVYETKKDKIPQSQPIRHDIVLKVYDIDTDDYFVKEGAHDLIDNDRLAEILYALIDWDIKITSKNGFIWRIDCYNNTKKTLGGLARSFPVK